MSTRQVTGIRLLAEFGSASAMLAAIEALRRERYHDLETYAPFDIPQLDERLGLRRSRLGWGVLVAGIAGLVAGYGIQWWANVHSYPLNVGGRPQNAIPAFVLAAFEGTVLASALAAFCGFLVTLRLPRLWSIEDEVDGFHRASIDRFWIAMHTFASENDRAHAERLLREAGALRTITRVGPTLQRMAGPLALVLLLALSAYGCSDHVGQRWDWKRMRSQSHYVPYEANTFFPDGKAMRTPPAGTIPREASQGVAHTLADSAALLHGETRFAIFCAVCHGENGEGSSVVGDNMRPIKPPSLMTAAMRALTPQQVYAVITRGFGQMPSYAAELTVTDRWAVVAYVAELQRRTPPR